MKNTLSSSYENKFFNARYNEGLVSIQVKDQDESKRIGLPDLQLMRIDLDSVNVWVNCMNEAFELLNNTNEATR
tara:strand:- start:77 stop:298 length:222 start_codon:yes stop_codon:yes gene_type:complete